MRRYSGSATAAPSCRQLRFAGSRRTRGTLGALDLRTAYSPPYLLDQLLRTLVAKRPAVARRLRPGRTSAQLLALAGFRDATNALPAISWWFRQFDGQPKQAPPVLERRRWRAVSSAEAMATEPGPERTPLFVDADARYICFDAEAPGALRYLDGKRGKLPALDTVLLEALADLGWAPAAEAAPTAPLGALLAELDAVMAVYAGQRGLPIGLATGAPPARREALAAAFGLAALPAELDAWFAWHDGEVVDEDTLHIHDTSLIRALPIDASLRELAAQMADGAWNAAWIPLLCSELGERWGYAISGEARGAIIAVHDEDDGGAFVAWPSLASFVSECVS